MKNSLILASILLTIANIAILISFKETTTKASVKNEDYISICNSTEYSDKIHCLTNYERAENELKPLKVSEELQQVSREKSEDMCKKGYFSHDYQGRSWEYYIEKSGISYYSAGENLAKGYELPEYAMTALLNSPKHLENIMGDYNSLGVYTSSCGGINYTTQTFATL